jgi:hypothetical protein
VVSSRDLRDHEGAPLIPARATCGTCVNKG